MAKEKTISDYIANDNKKLSFEERARKFEVLLEPLCKEYGVVPWAKIQYSDDSIIAIPQIKDIWDSSNVSNESGK